MRLLLSAKFIKHHGRGLRTLMHKTTQSMKHLTHAMGKLAHEEAPKKIGGAVKRINPIKFKF